jgi:hypothetical protein
MHDVMDDDDDDDDDDACNGLNPSAQSIHSSSGPAFETPNSPTHNARFDSSIGGAGDRSAQCGGVGWQNGRRRSVCVCVVGGLGEGTYLSCGRFDQKAVGLLGGPPFPSSYPCLAPPLPLQTTPHTQTRPTRPMKWCFDPNTLLSSCFTGRMAATAAAAALARPSAASPLQQPPKELPSRIGHRQPQLHRLLGLLLLLASSVSTTTASAFVVPPRGGGGLHHLQQQQQQQQQQQHPHSTRPPSSSSTLLPRPAFNFFGGGGGGGNKKQQQQPKREENPFRPELQGVYNDGLGAKIWIYLFSGKIAQVRFCWEYIVVPIPIEVVLLLV